MLAFIQDRSAGSATCQSFYGPFHFAVSGWLFDSLELFASPQSSSALNYLIA
jgi:hypothetical protein